MYKFIAILFVSLLTFSDATNVRRCKNGQPFPLSVDVKGCTQPPCDVIKGTTAVMDVHFVGTRDNLHTLNAKVHATALGITTPYELPKNVANVCANLLNGATCPLSKGEDVIYKFNFFIDSQYPEIPVSVEVSLNDENNKSVACFVCDIKVKKRSAH